MTATTHTRQSYDALIENGEFVYANCPRCGDKSQVQINPDTGNKRAYCGICGEYFKPKNPAAVALGSLGGKSTSEAKKKSSAANGRLGGRPRTKKS